MENVLLNEKIKKDKSNSVFDLDIQNNNFENFDIFNPKMVLLEETKENNLFKYKRVHITGIRFIFEDGIWEF